MSAIEYESADSICLRERAAFKEHNDCTVWAFTNATNRSYGEAHELLAQYGRKRRKGFRTREFLGNCEDKIMLGHRFHPLNIPTVTIAKFVRGYTEGVFLCRISKHVFVIRDGKVVDTLRNKPGSRITDVWEVTPA